MKNLRFQFLEKYYENVLEKNSYMLEKVDSFFKPANDLYANGFISLKENDLLVEALCDFQTFLFEFISNCPFIEIKLNNKNDDNANNSKLF